MNPDDFRKHTADYQAYMTSPEWAEKRKAALERANYTCQLCGWRPRVRGHGGLHVHHNSYERVFREEPHDLVCLCGACHKAFHDRVNRQKHRSRSATGWGRNAQERTSKRERITSRQHAWMKWRLERNRLVADILDGNRMLSNGEALAMANAAMDEKYGTKSGADRRHQVGEGQRVEALG